MEVRSNVFFRRPVVHWRRDEETIIKTKASTEAATQAEAKSKAQAEAITVTQAIAITIT